MAKPNNEATKPAPNHHRRKYSKKSSTARKCISNTVLLIEMEYKYIYPEQMTFVNPQKY